MTDHSFTRFLAIPEGDVDPTETGEWRDAFLALVATEGPQMAAGAVEGVIRGCCKFASYRAPGGKKGGNVSPYVQARIAGTLQNRFP